MHTVQKNFQNDCSRTVRAAFGKVHWDWQEHEVVFILKQNNVPLPFYDRARRRANNGNLLPGSSSVNGHSRSTRSSTLRSAAKLGHFNVYTTNDEEANRHQEFETNEDEMEQAKVEDGEEEVEDEQELVDNLRDRLRNKPTLNGNNNNRLNSMRIIRR
jgi:hypothetical protein